MLREVDHWRLAIGDVHGVGLTYGDLRSLVIETHKCLAAQGVRRRDVVALSFRNSPETAALFLALVTYCRVAPLNPAYTEHELAFALRDVDAVALIVPPEGADAATTAVQLGLAVIWLQKANFTPGAYELQPEMPAFSLPRSDTGSAPDDIALLLHTSGTTSRPKLVPLTNRNLCASSLAVAEVLRLAPEDRCLSIMPLFHIHGLVAGLLASVAAGASVLCPLGFDAIRFLSWLDSSQATWYTAVPTMHQAILARAFSNPDLAARHKLRVIRSSSAPLHSSLWAELEKVFAVPVLNAYGMTEAAHQIASVRLDSSSASRTTVGPSSGPEVAIMNSQDRVLPPGQTGEVVIRGEQITRGYLKPDSANATAFQDGWLRTGDEGFLNSDGALTLTGRLKEMINSGGEKVSPYEVEEALLTHPAVAQAVVFAAPHRLLGEQVMAAVVLREGKRIPERELLDVTSSRIARCKLPRRILFLDELPRGATGKVQRIGLYARLGLNS